MPEITPRRRGELVRGVFNILLSHTDGLPAKTILERLQQIVPPTAFEQTTYSKRPDTRRYEKIVRFSTIGPVKAGWLTSLQKSLIDSTESGVVSSQTSQKSR
jgi:restriction system protein